MTSKFSNSSLILLSIVPVIKNNLVDFDFSLIKEINENKVVFTNISRIIPYKGHLFLIELFSEIIKKRNDCILQIVGDTLPFYEDYFKSLNSKLKQDKIEKNITFLGYRNDIKSILDKSHFFIHTPINPDPLPTVIFEAIQSKTPVICTDNGGAREILNDFSNGLLIDYNDVKKSSQLILNYIDDLDRQKKNVNDSMNFILENFNNEIFSQNIKSLISKT